MAEHNIEHSEVFELDKSYFERTPPEAPTPPSKSPKRKSVTFDDVVRIAHVEVPNYNDEPTATTMLEGLLGFTLLSTYLFLLFLNDLASFTFTVLSHVYLYTELALFKTWCAVFDFQQRRVINVLCIPGALALTVATMVACSVVLWVVAWMGVLWGLLWWVRIVMLAFAPGAERVMKGWLGE